MTYMKSSDISFLVIFIPVWLGFLWLLLRAFGWAVDSGWESVYGEEKHRKESQLQSDVADDLREQNASWDRLMKHKIGAEQEAREARERYKRETDA